MATINLGNIKFNWQGAYAGGTAYAVDDVVSYNGSSYICKLASTGNLPTNTTYWDQMSSAGTNGTNGTDLTTTLTTQGDLVYRDGSGLQRLGIGSAGQALKVNSGATAIEWGSAGGLVETGFVLATGSQTINSSTPVAITHTTFSKSLTAGQKISITENFGGYQDENDRVVKKEIYVTPPGGSAISIANTATGSGGMGISSSNLYSFYFNIGAIDIGIPTTPVWVYQAQTTGTHSFRLYGWCNTTPSNFSIGEGTFHYQITNV